MGVNWQELIKLAAPAVGEIASGGRNGAFLSGYQQEQEAIAQEQRQKLLDQQHGQQASADYLLKIGEHLQGIQDPTDFTNFLTLAEDAGLHAGYTKPGELKGRFTYSDTKRSEAQLKELTAQLDSLEKDGYNLDELAQSDGHLTLKNGKTIPIADAVEIARKRPVTSQGAPIAKPKKPAPVTAGSEKERAAQLLGEISDAKTAGDPATAAKKQQQYDNLVRATKELGQADDRPLQGSVPTGEAEDIANAIIAGDQPPTLTGLYRYGAAVRASLAKQHYDLTTAQTDWAATQKHIATLNGPQQLRLTQSINALPEMLDTVDGLAAQWKGGRFPILNKANLALAKNGAYGPQVASVANQLAAQIADITADLGNVYMGGNSPTDHALSLAAKSLSADWDQKVLKDMIALAKKNVQIRLNSIRTTGVAGASPTNPYAPPAAPAVAPPPPAGGGGLTYEDYLRSKGQQ